MTIAHKTLALAGLLLLIALLLVLTAPVSLWLTRLELPSGVELVRSEGSLRAGELILSVAALGVDKPVYLAWQGCGEIGWQRCWQATGRGLQGSGKLALWPNGSIELRDSQLWGDMVLNGVFVLPVSGKWQVDIGELSFNTAACLPAGIDSVEANIKLREGQMLQQVLSPHSVQISRRPGEDFKLALAGYSASGTVTMDAAGKYRTDLVLRLPEGIVIGPVTGGAPGSYNLQQQGVLSCM